MASAATSSSSHLAVTDNQKRWLVAGIALNKILVPQIRPFLNKDVDKEYNKLKISHKIDTQSTSGRLQRWPARKFLKYENINGNDVHPRLPGGRYNYSLFDCRVLSHIDFAKLYVENYMAKFNAFDDHCDASAVLLLLGGVPVFTPDIQAAAGDVRQIRNDWAHCDFTIWDQAKFQQSFAEMEHLVGVMSLPAANEGKLLQELKDWENKGTLLCINSPVDPVLLQLIQQEVKSLQDDVDKLSLQFDKERDKVRQELQTVAVTLVHMEEKMHSLETGQQDLQCLVEERIGALEGKVDDLTFREKEYVLNSAPQDSVKQAVYPEKFVELIRRDYQGAVLCPFPWCEDELQLELANLFTRLQIVSKTKERAKLTDDTVNVTDVFRPHKECKNPRVVLVEGNPGIGKTTLCQKLAYDWSVGDVSDDASFPKVEILLLLKCRDINVRTTSIEEVIADQLLPQDSDEKEKENFFGFIRANQPRILLVLDGLDELHQDLLQSVLPLIKGKVVSNAYVMLTARHEAGVKVRRYCDTLLQIIGYTKDDAENYIRRYFRNHDDPSLADRLIKRLHNDNQLRELTTNPLNTSLLCLVCEETGDVFPSKRTKLYDTLVECALRRYFAKRGVSLDGDNPVEICTEQLKQLGKMAFEALLKDQMYFSENEMKDKSSDFLQLCFLSRQPSASKIKRTPCYAFTHKTFQEYFAAFYLAHLVLNDDKGTNAFLALLSPVDNWQVWEFLVTMVANKRTEKAGFVVSRLCAFFFGNRYKAEVDSNADVDIDEDTFEERTDDWTKPERLSKDQEILCSVVTKTLRLVAECEDDATELMDYQKTMVHVLARCFPLRDLQLSPSSRYCPVYSEFLKHSCKISNLILKSDLNNVLLATVQCGFPFKNKLARFSLENNSLVDRFIALLVPKDQQLRAWCDLHRRLMWIQLYGVKALLSVLQPCSFLTHLHFSNVWLRDGGAAAIAEFLLANRALTHLSLHYALICDKGALRLAVALQTNCSLTHLNLQENWISGVGAGGLAQSLQSNGALEYLNLSLNLGGDSVAVALARSLESNCGMKYLDLSQNFGATDRTVPFPDSDNVHVELIGASGSTALGRALRVNCTLTFLNLNHNCISNEGATAVGEALKHNCTLTHLNLENNEVGVSGAEALGKALQTNRSLKHLNLAFNSIGDLGAAALAEALNSSGTGLSRLALGFNKISCSGATAISEALRCNCSLTHLALRHNKIVSIGAAAFAKTLLSNHALSHLNLGDNDIDDSGATELVQALQYYNNTLRYLNLKGNPIGSGGKANLEHVDQANCNVCF